MHAHKSVAHPFFFSAYSIVCDVMWLMACRLVIYFLNKMMNFQKHQFGWTGRLNSGFNYFISYFWRIVYGTLAHCTSVCLCCILLLEFETAELEMKKHSVRGIATVLLYSTCMWVVPDASSSALESCSDEVNRSFSRVSFAALGTAWSSHNAVMYLAVDVFRFG